MGPKWLCSSIVQEPAMASPNAANRDRGSNPTPVHCVQPSLLGLWESRDSSLSCCASAWRTPVSHSFTNKAQSRTGQSGSFWHSNSHLRSQSQEQNQLQRQRLCLNQRNDRRTGLSPGLRLGDCGYASERKLRHRVAVARKRTTYLAPTAKRSENRSHSLEGFGHAVAAAGPSFSSEDNLSIGICSALSAGRENIPTHPVPVLGLGLPSRPINLYY